MRVRTPLRKVGVAAQRWAAWRAKSRLIVEGRSRGRCEVTGQRNVALELHHLFDRDWEPFSSHPACLLAIALPLHRDLEQERLTGLHDALRFTALEKLAAEFNETAWYEMTNRVGESAMDAWRRLLQRLEEHYEYDAKLNAIVSRP